MPRGCVDWVALASTQVRHHVAQGDYRTQGLKKTCPHPTPHPNDQEVCVRIRGSDDANLLITANSGGQRGQRGQRGQTAAEGYFLGALVSPESEERAAMKASCGTSTRPTIFIRFLPSFCFSSSLRLRLMSPP